MDQCMYALRTGITPSTLLNNKPSLIPMHMVAAGARSRVVLAVPVAWQ